MRKQPNGFTIVEVLAIIVVLGITMLIILPNIIGISDREKTTKYNQLLDNIYLATETYISNAISNPTYPLYIPLQNVIDGGYIETPLINPLTDEDINYNDYVVAIKNGDNTNSYIFPGSENGLIANYKLDGNGEDSSSFKIDGTISNVTSTTNRLTLANKAMDFDGLTSFVEIPDSSNLRLASGGTISTWVYPRSLGENAKGRILDKSTGTSGNNGYIFGGMATNALYFQPNAGVLTLSSNNAINLNTWNHVTVTFNASGRKIYVNGIDVTSTGGAETTLPPNIAGVVAIGNRASNTDRTFDGKIDDLKVYNRVLLPAEIAVIYNIEKDISW